MITEVDKEILLRTRIVPGSISGEATGLSVFTGWYFGMEMLPKQIEMHHALQPNVLVLGGVASGKTSGRALSSLAYATTTPYYRFLNVSISSFQANLMFEYLMARIDGNKRYEKFISNIRKKPYPEIELVTGASLSFMTVGYEAQHIRGSEFDEINFDEGGYEPYESTLSALRGRLRGTRPDGTPRMGRLTITTTPTDAPWLYERWRRGAEPEYEDYDPDRYHSIRVTIYENYHLPQWQIKEIEQDTPAELRDQELSAEFPILISSEFPRDQVEAITDMDWLPIAEQEYNAKGPKSGYSVSMSPRLGVVRWEAPLREGHVYVLSGDPGSNAPPHRNAPCIICLDVTTLPYKLVFFSWPSGKGRYAPFLSEYRYALDKYSPVYKGIDATGPQKALDELAFDDLGIALDNLNFQKDKYAMLNSLRVLIQNEGLKIPFIKGFRQQLINYRLPDNKIAQDIVSALMGATHLAKYVNQSPETDQELRPGTRLDSRARRAYNSYRRSSRRRV